MNENKILPDDPRLTAYALGELAGPELAAVEAALRDDAAARAAVAEIRAAGAQLKAALATESMPPLRAESESRRARAAIIAGRDLRKLDGGPGRQPGEIFRYSRSFFVLTGLAAACLVLVFSLRQPPTPAPEVAVASIAKKIVSTNAPVPVASVPAEKDVAAPPMPAAPSPAVAQDSSLLAQAKNMEVAKENNGPGLKDSEFPKLGEKLTITESGGLNLGTRSAVTEAGAAPPTEPAVARNDAVATVAPTAAVSPPPAAARDNGGSAGAIHVFPPDDKFVVQAIPQGPETVVTAKSAPPTNAVTLDNNKARVFPAPPVRNEPLAPPRGLASNTTGQFPFSENRGLPGFVPPINFDLTSPRYSPAPAGQNEVRAGEHDNDFISVAQQPVSTFAIDSDTAGYADVRNFLQKRQRPPRELVHIEEMLNFFPFGYAPPQGDAPFAASMEVADAPWLPAHRLVRLGLKAREVTATPRPPANLVFVLDVLTTERQRSQLPMIRESIEFLLGRLRADDRVAIVSTLNGASQVLPPTPVAKASEIVAALARLGTIGSSSRAKGLQLAYEIARANFFAGGGNHVILCTDGNAATTITAEGPLARLIETQTKAGVTLTAFGFGMGLYRDSLIELLADYGKGNYAYIDTRRAAEKFLVEDVNGPSVTVAKDVAVEVEFNPAKVARYRLIGYENRVLKKEDFKGEAFDVDEISAGHAVTALFEIEAVPTRADAAAPALDPNELLTMKVRYKKPGGALARKIDFPLFDSRKRFVDASADFKFAAAVAGLGMILRDSPHKGATTLTQVIEWAESAAGAGSDPGGYRSEFVELAREAEKIQR